MHMQGWQFKMVGDCCALLQWRMSDEADNLLFKPNIENLIGATILL